jgi:putative DNA primase/helicase
MERATPRKEDSNIVPFTHKPATPDPDLMTKQHAEWPGILRWLIDGCLAWQRVGLVRPPVVTEATAEYFEEQDTIRHWIEERC